MAPSLLLPWCYYYCYPSPASSPLPLPLQSPSNFIAITIRSDPMQSDPMQSNPMQSHLIQPDAIWSDTIWHDAIWSDTMQSDLIRCNPIWYSNDAIWSCPMRSALIPHFGWEFAWWGWDGNSNQILDGGTRGGSYRGEELKLNYSKYTEESVKSC